MKNDTNIQKYRRLAPVYDLFFSGILSSARRRAISELKFRPGEKILLMGVGTREDLKYMPANCSITGIDICDDMLVRARTKITGRDIALMNMNAEQTEFPDAQFDCVILNLILSVAENPRNVMKEALRVLKPDGRIIAFDKFLGKNKSVSPPRKLLNALTSSIGTDINRCFEDIIDGLPVMVLSDRKVMLGDAYRAIEMRHPNVVKDT